MATVPNSNFINPSKLDDLTPGFYRANPKDIRFSQSDASPFFNDGRRVHELIDDLVNNRITADQVGSPLQVLNVDGKLFSLDNRHLAAFNHAGVDDIHVQFGTLDDPAFAQKFFDGRFDPIDGEGLDIIFATSKQRAATQQLLFDLGKINGTQLKK